MRKFFRNHKIKLIFVVYLIILISIPVSAFALRDVLVKKPVPPSPVLMAGPEEEVQIIITPSPVASPVIAPSPVPSPTKAAGKTAAKKSTSTASKTTQAPGPKAAGIPVRIQIPKIGMNAAVEQVGLQVNGEMGVPASWWTVGWYNLGYKVGDNGSAVMSGHYDTSTGAPAVFYKVKNLAPGDIITVTNSNGSVYKFRVFKREEYPWNQLPMQNIFNTSGRTQLNLITCSGTWDRATKNYSHRTVVYSEVI